VAVADGRGGPFADAVNRQNRRLVKRRRIKRAGRVGLVVFGKKDRAIGTQSGQFTANGFAQIQFLAEPVGQHDGKCAPAAGSDGEIRFEQSRKFQNELVVKHHRVELHRRQVRVAETKLGGVTRKIGIVFLAREKFLLRSGDDFSVHHQRGSRVVIIRRDAEDIVRRGHRSKKRIQRPGDAGVGGEDQDRTQQQQHDDERDEPPFFSCRENLKNSLRSDHMNCYEFMVCPRAGKRNQGVCFLNIWILARYS